MSDYENLQVETLDDGKVVGSSWMARRSQRAEPSAARGARSRHACRGGGRPGAGRHPRRHWHALLVGNTTWARPPRWPDRTRGPGSTRPTGSTAVLAMVRKAACLQEWHYFFANTMRWRNLRKITIAQVNGKVYAAGLMLMWPAT